MNELQKSKSLYLQQHANNPVYWKNWSDDVFEKAKKENKLVIISIGYSSCHWCHVMEKESFENEAVAEVMNEHFICVKVDREERPDVDQFFMQAVQIMTKQGGWPLNCITTPDGKPIYGGTYFPKDQWVQILETLQNTFSENPEKIYDYAQKLDAGMHEFDQMEHNQKAQKVKLKESLDEMVVSWRQNFDHEQGGMNHAPKFPMPNNYEFLLRYAFHNDDQKLETFVLNTLHKMGNGGIFDHVGGGFARYSTDMQWKVPHFEKMLYDNAQLLSLYSKAFQKTKDQRFKITAYKIWDWLEREMQHPKGGYYAAIDADSEGVEGRFYVWTRKELNEVFEKEEKEQFSWYYDLDKTAEWEDWIIIQRIRDVEQVAKFKNIPIEESINLESELLGKLFNEREKRERPVTDFKRITSWNALLLEAFCDAFNAFEDEEFYSEAEKLGYWMNENTFRKAGGLWHVNHDNGPDIEGFLEDYATVASAYLKLYQTTFDDQWIIKVRHLLQYVQIHFEDNNNALYYFSDEQFSSIINRKKEVSDNVIPASNSILARAFIGYGKIIGDTEYIDRGEQMIEQIASRFNDYGPGFSNWGMAAMEFVYPNYELAFTGEKALLNRSAFAQQYFPNVKTYGGDAEYVPTLEGKGENGKNLMYLCTVGACQKPSDSLEEIYEQIQIFPSDL